MVFHFRCFSFGDGESRVRTKSSSVDTFYTASKNFHNASDMSPESKRRSALPTLAERPSNLRLFTHAELKEATRNFDPSTKIGEGGYGSVHMGVIRSFEYPYNEINVAVKRGKKGVQGHRQWLTEVNVLGEVEHPNLVKLVGYCIEDDESGSHRLLVYEYMPNRSLDDHLFSRSNVPLSWTRRLKVAQDAARGLTYLHEGMERQIIFRDFKPSNILLDNQWKARLSDFGFARLGPPEGRTHVSTMVVGTKGYAAPEYVQTGRLTSKSDVWSYGVFLEELITGRHPLAKKGSNKMHKRLECLKCCCYSDPGKSDLIVDPRLKGQYSEQSVQKLSSIAKKCLAKDAKVRPKMSEVLEMVNQVVAIEDRQQPNLGHT